MTGLRSTDLSEKIRVDRKSARSAFINGGGDFQQFQKRNVSRHYFETLAKRSPR